MMTQQMQSGTVDTKAAYKSECDQLELLPHAWALTAIEERCLENLREWNAAGSSKR